LEAAVGAPRPMITPSKSAYLNTDRPYGVTTEPNTGWFLYPFKIKGGHFDSGPPIRTTTPRIEDSNGQELSDILYSNVNWDVDTMEEFSAAIIWG